MSNCKSLKSICLLLSMLAFACSVPATSEFETTKKAAEQGDAEAQLNLGLMYAHGDGVPEDFVQAYAWISIAAANGSETYKRTKKIIAGRMTSAQLAEAQKLSRDYREAYGLGRENQ